MSKQTYGENGAISSLKDEEKVRKRPAVIFGTNDVNGCAQAVFEIIANSVDEAREGYGETIEITLDDTGLVRVKDNGRGVPMDWNEGEGRYNWELVFCTLYASGKYDSTNYEQSLGLNGLGATATQYASEFMDVASVRNGKKYVMHFKKGRPVGQLEITDTTEENGTDITFRPDKEVFRETVVPLETYINKLRSVAMLHPKIKIVLKSNDQTVELAYPGGISEFLGILCEKPLIQDSIYFSGESVGRDYEDDDGDYRLKMEFAIMFSREGVQLCETYHNGAYMSDGGSTYDGLWAGIVKAIDEEAKNRGKINRGDRIISRDVEEILLAIGVTNCPGHRTEFKNQTKTAIGNLFIKKSFYDFVLYNFSRWMNENKTQSDRIIAEVVANKEAREAADIVKKKALKKLTSGIDKFGERPAKFIECSSKNPHEREVYIVEGDSAAGSCKLHVTVSTRQSCRFEVRF